MALVDSRADVGMRTNRHVRCLFSILLALGIVLSSAGGAVAQEASPAAVASPAIAPVVFPRDDGPHDQPVEWWYYTGHLFTDDGDRYGFEYVVFKARERGFLGYASHFAVTDNTQGTFQYDQRQALAPPDANAPSETGFDLAVGDWTMRGVDGDDQLVAAMPGYGIDLTLTAEKPPAIHDGDGFIDFGDGQFTYYYSRTRIAVEGTLTVDGVAQPVTGLAWFDHQWGDFFGVVGSGWDWYSLQLDDETELMLYVVRALDGSPLWVRGSFVAPDGAVTDLASDQFTITPAGSWTSPTTGIAYPSGWTVDLPEPELSVTLTPSLPDQELDTTETTRVIYWEGEVVVAGTRADEPIAGLGYVELTGYLPR